MARIRSVKPNLFGSYSLTGVPISARYLFIGLFTEADDEGRLIDSPKRISGSLFPHDEEVTVKKVDSWLTNLSTARGEDGWPCIVRYATETGRYIAIPSWTKHQKISHALDSQLPSIPGPLLETLTKDACSFLEKIRSASAVKGN